MFCRREVVGLVKSFSYAIKGIAFCMKNERNMRIHLSMIVLVSMFAYCFGVTGFEYIVLTLCMGLVVSAEMINTAIETLTNLESPSYNRLARIAKDVAAGAVLVAAIMSIIVGGVIFLKFDRLWATFTLIVSTPLYWISFATAIVILFIFVFNGGTFFKEPKTKVYHTRSRR